MSTRVNTFVVPGVIVTFVLIALAIWTAVEGWSVIDGSRHYNQEQAPRAVAQNFVAAHNAGIASAWLLPLISQFVNSSKA